MKLYNSLSKSIEEFKPIAPKKVGIYSCGPTVYWNQHIGHMYAYVQWDILVRFLRYSGNEVNWVMNITDVGHLTSDEDTGEDKMEKGAKREGISVWDLAEKYITQFIQSLKLLNIESPDTLSRATDHIDDQIKLAQEIEKNGFAYKTKKGLVFDTEKFTNYTKFARLKLDKQKKRKDVEDDPDKKQSWDFFLWVIDPDHAMSWESPWGKGYPGWHIECTAMSTKYLGKKFDIHTGGLEHIPVHHTNEVAQAYGAYGEMTANYWLHNAWLLSKGGEKMSKSLGNFVTVQELVEKGYDPLALRYLFLTSNYRKGLNFSWESLEAAQKGFNKFKSQYSSLKKGNAKLSPTAKKLESKFTLSLENDLNTPQALAVAWEVLKSNLSDGEKQRLILSFDKVLGLNIEKSNNSKKPTKIPKKVSDLAEEREKLRKQKKFKEADNVRKQIMKLGFELLDTDSGVRINKLPRVKNPRYSKAKV